MQQPATQIRLRTEQGFGVQGNGGSDSEHHPLGHLLVSVVACLQGKTTEQFWELYKLCE
jgi:hypothetical protein